ncbi:hypothetical protein QCN29_23015 [Streptomyces sp. HNM0663]|uniref:Uncharacterized protein n=1 Tax=Streptomyces chengmaiensis TaxID=3040919 RepID=A0ABT6HSB0_9ACTN|nr:hypothetical protein [Streptomyces chengmaiensis]MDH2391597.1 hypothetical protein [Streptomyces chengmaiensis]
MARGLPPDRPASGGARAAAGWSLSEGIDGSTSAKTFFQERISDVVSRASNDVRDLAPRNEQVRDAANLIDSAALHYLENPGATLRQAIKTSCDQDVDDLLGWIQD